MISALTALSIAVFICLTIGGRPSWGGELSVVYTGNLEGELEPCGCSAGVDMGGILRRATTVERWRRERVGLILISAGGLLGNEGPRDRLKNEFILKGIAALRYDAIALQRRDLAFGASFISTPRLPWVASNAATDTGFSPQRVISRGAVRLAFFAWLDPSQSTAHDSTRLAQVTGSTLRSVRQAIKRAKNKNYLTVLSTSLPLVEAQSLFQLADIDILLIRAAAEVYGEPQRVGHTVVLQPGSRGMRLARLDIEINSNRRIANWNHSVIELSPEVPNFPGLLSWYEEYNAKVKEAYLASARVKRAQESGLSLYAGAHACETCHQAIFSGWSQTKHATAFVRLERINKQYDPDCIACHSVGFTESGGFVDAQSTPKLMNVQCESCHGPSRKHIEANGALPVTYSGWDKARICGQCHTQAHSPSFRIDEYWRQMAH